MNYLKLLLVVVILVADNAFAQQKKYTISGYVKEKGSKELLTGVNIYSPKLKVGTVSNSYGFYSLTLPSDSVDLVFSYIGYAVHTENFYLSANKELNVEMQTTVFLKELVVNSVADEKVSETVQMSVIKIPVGQIKELPAILGENDVFKIVQLMPGVKSGGANALYIRGGGPDQNLIILDDAIMYNVSHAFGIFSLFNGDALKSVELTKAGFPAKYGGRLSAILEMNMKDGNKEKYSGTFGIGIISSHLTFEGPIVKDKCSFMFSARRTYLDLFTKNLQSMVSVFESDINQINYFFYDYNAKLNYDFGRKNKLFLSGYFGKDKLSLINTGNKLDFKLLWGNATATARWNHLFNNKLFSNTTLTYSKYNFNVNVEENHLDEEGKYYYDFRSSIRDYSLKYDMEYVPSPVHYFKAGISCINHYFSPSTMVMQMDTFVDNRQIRNYNNFESGLYIEDNINLFKFKINPGVRVSHFLYKNKSVFNPEPRLSCSYMIKENLSYKVSFAMMNQYMQLLGSEGIGMSVDLWVPSTDKISPQKSFIVATGIAKDFIKENFTLTLEAYYKKSKNVIGYKEGASYYVNSYGAEQISWESNVTAGKSWSYGAELFLQKKKGKFSGWLGYTLSWTWLQFDELNKGDKYFAKYDRRHDISFVLTYKPKEKITISGTWVYVTGNAVSLPQAKFTINTNPYYPYNSNYNIVVTDYGKKNDFRLPAFHKADIAVQFHKQKKKHERIWQLSVYNIYCKAYAISYYIAKDKNNITRLYKNPSITIIPSISYVIKF